MFILPTWRTLLRLTYTTQRLRFLFSLFLFASIPVELKRGRSGNRLGSGEQNARVFAEASLDRESDVKTQATDVIRGEGWRICSSSCWKSRVGSPSLFAWRENNPTCSSSSRVFWFFFKFFFAIQENNLACSYSSHVVRFSCFLFIVYFCC